MAKFNFSAMLKSGGGIASAGPSVSVSQAVLDQIAKEMEAARRSPGQVREEFRKGHVGGALPTEAKPEGGWIEVSPGVRIREKK